jgi:hypothetical protein
MTRLAIAALALAFASAPAFADSASGTFKSRDITMGVKSAVAYRAKSTFDKDRDVIVVAITNARIKADKLAEYVDRGLAIDKRIKDDETGIVNLEFQPDGKYRGLSYYFASGNGCGYCSGGVESTVKLANGKLAGTLKQDEKDRSFDVTLDVSIMSDDHGGALPANGGEPGAAYLAYHAALVKRDGAALKPLISASMQSVWADAEKENKVDAYMKYLADDHPTKSVQVTKGYAKGDLAVLLIAGESSYSKMTGEVMLVKEKGGWRVDDELTRVVMQ